MAERATSTGYVTFARPVDLPSSLATLGRWGDDLVDRWDGRELVRSVPTAGARLTAFRARPSIDPAVELRIECAEDDPAAAAAAVTATFVLDDDALRELAERDRRVAALVERYPAFAPVLVPDPFMALLRSISAQQVNLAWAATIRARIARRYGRRLSVAESWVYAIEPAALAATSVAALRELQLTTAKARSVIAVSRAAQLGELQAGELGALDDEPLIAHLTALPGIGRWSAEWFLARTLGRPRVVCGDLGVRKALARLYDVPLPTETEVRRLTDHWGAAATMAQALALHDLAVRPGPAPAR